MIGKQNKKNELFFFIEVKRPQVSSRYQVEDDYTKLLKEMKGSIDDQLRVGKEDPLSHGLLAEGMLFLHLFLAKKIHAVQYRHFYRL